MARPVLLALLAPLALLAAAGGGGAAAKTTVHVLAHSHDDYGWVRTADEYYQDFVRDIYDTAVAALAASKRRKFQAVEQGYFSRWYGEATEEQRAEARKLVAEGRLEFAVGGWTMPDEACVDLPDMVEGMTLGHDFILREFGVRPRFGFQVDPFGASSEFAQVSALLGFNAHIISRVDSWEKARREADRTLEFVWRPSAAQPHLQILTHMMDSYSYCTPGLPADFQKQYFCDGNLTDCPGGGFYFDGDDSRPASYWQAQYEEQGYQVYPYVNASNVKYYAEFAAKNMLERAKFFSTPHTLWPFGCDFQHFNSTAMFRNMDLIIDYLNEHHGDELEVRYSTLSDYFGALHAGNTTWPTRGEDDFMSYTATDGDTGLGKSWTGYYTSHAWLKARSRAASALLRATDALVVAAAATAAHAPSSGDLAGLRTLREAVGALTHHDAVTGTAGPGVADAVTLPEQQSTVVLNYNEMLENGTSATASLRASAVNALLQARAAANGSAAGLEDGVGGLASSVRQGCAVPLVAFNPTGWALANASVRFALSQADVAVSAGAPRGGAAFQVLRRWAPMLNETGAPQGAVASDYEVEVEAALPALGHAAFLVRSLDGPAGGAAAAEYSPEPAPVAGGSLETSGHASDLRFVNGSLVGIRPASASSFRPVRASLLAYRSAGNNTAGSVSGSYIFRPEGDAAPLDDAYDRPALQVIRGPIVTEVWQDVAPGVQAVYRVRRGDPRVEVEVVSGPLRGNRELVLSLETALDTGGRFTTDSNGAQDMARRFNGTTSAALPTRGYVIGANYRPITRYAYIRAGGEQLTVLAARAHGACSVRSGQLEVMLHRRELQDDNLGACFAPDMPNTTRADGCPASMIPLNVTTRVRTRLWLVYGGTDAADEVAWRRAAVLGSNPPLLFSAPGGTSCSQQVAAQWMAAFGAPQSALAAPLPPSVHLMTLSPREGSGAGRALLRLRNLGDRAGDPTETVRLADTFAVPERWGAGEDAELPRLSLSGVWNVSALEDPDTLWRWLPAAPGTDPGTGTGSSVVLPPQRIVTLELTLDAAYTPRAESNSLFSQPGAIGAFCVGAAALLVLLVVLARSGASSSSSSSSAAREPLSQYGALSSS